MALNAFSIDGDTWTAITSAGESGQCWIQKNPDIGQVVINHSTSGSGSLDVNDSYFMPDNKSELVPIPADDNSDIFYARCLRSGQEATIISDVI